MTFFPITYTFAEIGRNWTAVAERHLAWLLRNQASTYYVAKLLLWHAYFMIQTTHYLSWISVRSHSPVVEKTHDIVSCTALQIACHSMKSEVTLVEQDTRSKLRSICYLYNCLSGWSSSKSCTWRWDCREWMQTIVKAISAYMSPTSFALITTLCDKYLRKRQILK